MSKTTQLREQIEALFLKYEGVEPYEYTVDAILDAVIAVLPEVRDIAGDDDFTMGHSDGQHDYKKKAIAILQAAKENKL